jgi:putative DNA primase/helicase
MLKTRGDRKAAKPAIDPLKKELPAFLCSGRFFQRANDGLIQHSGLLCADLDSLGDKVQDVRAKLLTSPYLSALFRSPTGDGLKAIVRVSADRSKHLGSFHAIEKHVRELTGIQIDEACKDVARLCFVSYDPEAYHNPNAQEITPLPTLVVKTPAALPSAEQHSKPDKAQIREMLAVIPKRPDYTEWIRIVAAVGDALPVEDVIDVLKEWSPEEREGEYADKLRHRLENVTVGTLIHLAREQGWRRPENPDPSRNAKAARELQNDIAAPDSGGNSADDETLSRLAAMPPLEYERIREAEAKRLGCRESILDKLVEAKRPPKPRNDTLQGQAVTLPNVEPWPEAVNGSEILDAIAERYTRFIVLPPGAADVLAVWTAHTHCYKIFQCSPRLNISSPLPRSGKSTLCDVTALFVQRPLLTENLSTAVLFRVVDAQSPTILADEYDTWLPKNDELRGLFNAGHRRGAMVYRCEGEKNEVRGFAAFAPAVLCGVGILPGTLHDRSIVVRLKRAKRGEIKARFDSRHVETETILCRKIARWCAGHQAKLEACDPQLPETAFNRIADNWRPLFAIAEVVGGDWPKCISEAFTKLTSADDLDAQGIGTLLLTDIAQIFSASNTDRLPSATLTESLAAIEGRPWAEWGKNRKPISTNQLANQLRHFEISPHKIRFGETTLQGYDLADFRDAFERYSLNTSNTSLSEWNTGTTLGKTAVFETEHPGSVFHPEKAPVQRECSTVPLQKGDKTDIKAVSTENTPNAKSKILEPLSSSTVKTDTSVSDQEDREDPEGETLI